jgi:hypothetical protein
MCWSITSERRPDASQLLAMLGMSYEGTRLPGVLCIARPESSCESIPRTEDERLEYIHVYTQITIGLNGRTTSHSRPAMLFKFMIWLAPNGSCVRPPVTLDVGVSSLYRKLRVGIANTPSDAHENFFKPVHFEVKARASRQTTGSSVPYEKSRLLQDRYHNIPGLALQLHEPVDVIKCGLHKWVVRKKDSKALGCQ